MGETEKIPHPKRAAFLAAYSKVATITHAASIAGIDPSTHYEWMKTTPEYAKEFAAAKQAACDNLEAEARRRAMVGCEKVIYYQGIECGRERIYSDVLLIVLMKASMPDKYIERRAIEHSAKGDTALKIAERIVTDRLPPAIAERMGANGNGNGKVK